MSSSTSTRKRKELPSRIQILNRQRRYRIDAASAALFCSKVLQALGAPDPALSVVFVGEEEMKKLNKSYLQRDYPTDVLCFAYNECTEDGCFLLGEIVVAPRVSIRNAARYRNTPEGEIRKLLVHGILHLKGYDHEADDGAMQRMQAKLTRRAFFKEGAPLLKQPKVRS
ncbi:MAG: rRNA maturation RNase YbeY [Acidobacteria bacterium]|nr:rRNA maturation RNase YbeY [Acidobacteriota bacterium]